MTDGLKAEYRAAIIDILAANERVERAVLFGSRAMETFTPTSDVDIALFGDNLTLTDQANLATAIDELPMAQRVDLLLHKTVNDEALRKHIEQYGVEWYRRRAQEGIERERGVLAERGSEPFGGKNSGTASEWKSVLLGKVVDLLVGFPFKSDRYVNDPDASRLLRGDNIAQGNIRWDGAKRWLLKAVDNVNQYWLRESDVVLAMDRPWIEAGLKFSSVRASDLPALLVQRVARLRGGDHLDTRFLNYVISCRDFTEYVLSVQTGTAVPHISARQIKEFEFSLPPLPEQRAIAHILGTLDDKIELNRRMNETLEEMAQTLFKSWFIDFDPVHAKAALRNDAPNRSLLDWTVERARAYLDGMDPSIAALLPDRFADSELGKIPEGWGVGKLKDAVDQLRDKENPLTSPSASFNHFSIPAYDEGQTPKQELGRSIKSTKTRVRPGVVLLSKLNPEIERVWLVDVSPDDQAVCSTEFLVLRAKPPFHRSYVYCLLRTPLFRQQIKSLVTGTSKSHQRAQAEAVLDLPIVVPPGALIDSFEKVAENFLSKTLNCRSASRALAVLRDALLPKLVSGELRVE